MHRAEQVLGQISANPVKAENKKQPLVSLLKQQGVGVIIINNPPVNSFSPAVQQALSDVYKQAIEDSEVKAIVITGAGKTAFMGGADIPSIATMQKQKDFDIKGWTRGGNALFNQIEQGKKPTVAAVNGLALGGGCELAMACNARVATPFASFGLPELKLGIIPGLGGTQRAPRLMGLQNAVQMTLASKTLKAKEAFASGLIDLIVKPEQLHLAAGQLALQMASGEKPRRMALKLQEKIPSLEEAKLIIEGAKQMAMKQTKGLVPHPFGYLEAVMAGVEKGGETGLEKETEVFAKLARSPTAVSLVHFFLASKATNKVPGVSTQVKRPIKNVAVIGAGTMGALIALVYLQKGYNVILKEINEKALEAGLSRLVDTVSRFLQKRKLPVNGVEQILRNLQPQITYDNFDKCDLVIEAALENIPLKQKIFQDLERLCNKDCILATNTSTIDLNEVGKLNSPQAQSRIVGLHFFSPAHVMPLLEIIRTEKTSNETLGSCLQMSKVIGKIPVVVGNCVGFTANRAFFPYGQAASFLVDIGVSPYRIDSALEKIVGMPMGVFKMSDLSGIDIFMHVSKQINAAYGSRCYNTPLGEIMFNKGRLGQKTGKGYYKYVKPGVPTRDDEGIAPLLQEARKKSGLPQINEADITDQQIVEMVLFPVVNESFRIVSEGHVIRESDVDVCSVTGYGFPAFHGGVCHWGRQQGLKYVVDRLTYFSDLFSNSSPAAKSFFEPNDFMKRESTLALTS